MRVECFTNLDAFIGVEWPTSLGTRPLVGDFIEGVQGNRRPRLRVVAVTHTTRKRVSMDENDEPVLRVELHK